MSGSIINIGLGTCGTAQEFLLCMDKSPLLRSILDLFPNYSRSWVCLSVLVKSTLRKNLSHPVVMVHLIPQADELPRRQHRACLWHSIMIQDELSPVDSIIL